MSAGDSSSANGTHNMDSLLSIGGSIASIGAAAWAYYQARLSSEHATKAEKFRDEIIKRREMVEVSQVHAETTRILKTVSQVGPSCTPSSARGVKPANIAKEVEEYARFLNEQSSHFTEFFDNKAKELCSDLNPLIEALSVAKEFDSIKEPGKSIYYKINAFMPEVKLLTDEKRELGKNA